MCPEILLSGYRSVIRGRNIKLVVVLVQSTFKDDVSEDRMIALRKRAEIDSKYLVVFAQNDTSELSQSLNRLASIFAELSNTYYREEGRRIKARLEKKSFSSAELNIRCCFKVAVYAEFRRDWVEALRFYEEAYHALHEMIALSTRLPPIQRLVEMKAVAEQLHFKVSTLLLHGGKVIEAITWFRQHISSYKRLVGAPEVVFLHWEWISKQFLVFAELLETSSATIPSTASLGSERPFTEWEFQPAYYYQLAAHYLREKRYSLDLSLSTSETSRQMEGATTIESPESVIPSVYVGQFARLLDQDFALAMQPLTDGEYVLYALAEGKRFQDSYEIIALFRKSFESYNNLKAQRMASYCSNQMAREYFAAGDFNNAKQLFDSIAGLYRQEGWVTLLWEILGYLRECSRNLGSPRDFIEYSLEMAALPILSTAGVEPSNVKEYGPAGPARHSQRENIQKEVFGLLKGQSTLMSKEGDCSLTVGEDQPLRLEIDPVSPLRVVFLGSVAFHDQTVKPGGSTLLTLSLLSQLPLPVEIDQLEIQFNQSNCNFTIKKSPELPLTESSTGEQACHVKTVPILTLEANKWLRLTFDIKSGQSGKLECLSVIASMGHHFTICCRVESPASMEDMPLWKFEDRVESFPTKDPALAFSGQKVIQVEEPEPQVDLILHTSGPALVGENFVVPVTITSKGHAVHSGELKINLVDTRGAGFLSPRETEPFSSDSLHVELVGISGSSEEHELQTGSENIKKIQASFGLLSVPFLEIGESWSGKLEIRWHRPKPIMLYVSLGYLPNSKETTAQKVHVHKSLQIEGKTPVVITHRFMTPFRRDPLLLSKIKPAPDSDPSLSLAFNETSILIVSARNCTEVPLRLISISIEVDRDEIGLSCTVRQSNEISTDLTLLVPGEEFKRVFSVTPEVASPKLSVGTVCLRWTRDSELGQPPHSGESELVTGVVTRHKLPNVNAEKAPLVSILECPPHAILGVPFSFHVRIRNQTQLLQEIKYSLEDSQSFLSSGPHNDAAFILPHSEHILGYKLVPLASGQQQLPRISVTSVRYSTGLHPSLAACTVFVFPSQPHFKTNGGVEEPKPICTE
ncbi:trafficking protein particle complex subunit-like protein isoform X2 [Tasmannia lanceolata]|uniref:trafficking protein particle complex subunit-like protein isoform X2 n=1 Tax=Tasmannia lanceolata TaxID=3420 RepID=UPI004062AABA